MSSMFCFQCEQTMNGKGCTINGVCGKKSEVANLQDELIGKLVTLAIYARDKSTPEIDKIIVDGLFTTLTNVNFDSKIISAFCEKVDEEFDMDFRAKFGMTAEKNMIDFWNENEDIRSLKSLILFGMKGMAAYAHHARVLGKVSDEINAFFL